MIRDIIKEGRPFFFSLLVVNDETNLKPEERRPRAACDKLEEGALLVLTELLHHGPEGGNGGVGQLVTP